MSLAKLKKIEAHKVLGVDASTNSLAFCIFENDKVISYGEVHFEGADIYERILDAKRKTKAMVDAGLLHADFMALEAGVIVKSAHVGIKMAYVFGTIMGEILADHMEVIEIHPITWQSYIGNKNFTKAEKQAVRGDFPGKSESWYKNKIRSMRKQKTLDFMREKGIITESDNVADAAGLAWYAVNNLMRNNG